MKFITYPRRKECWGCCIACHWDWSPRICQVRRRMTGWLCRSRCNFSLSDLDPSPIQTEIIQKLTNNNRFVSVSNKMIYQNNLRDRLFTSFSVKGGVESSYSSTNSRVTSAYFWATMGVELVESSSTVVCRLTVFSAMIFLFFICKRRLIDASAGNMAYFTGDSRCQATYLYSGYWSLISTWVSEHRMTAGPNREAAAISRARHRWRILGLWFTRNTKKNQLSRFTNSFHIRYQFLPYISLISSMYACSTSLYRMTLIRGYLKVIFTTTFDVKVCTSHLTSSYTSSRTSR